MCQSALFTDRTTRSLLLTFCATIYKWLQRIHVVLIHHIDQRRVDPTPRFYAVQATDHDCELHVERLVEVLNTVVVWCNLDALDPPLDESGCYLGLGLSYVVFSEEELSVQVGDVDCV